MFSENLNSLKHATKLAQLIFNRALRFMKKKLIILLLFKFLLFYSNCIAQNSKKLIKHGEQAITEGDYYGAVLYFRKAMEIDSSNLGVNYKYAEALRLYNDYPAAERYYNFVYQKDKGKQFPECLFWLAMMQKQNGKYTVAKKNFKKVNSKYKKNKNSYFFLKTNQEMLACDFSEAIKKVDTAEVNLRNIKEINSVHADFGGALINNEKMIFSSLRMKDDKSTASEIKNNEQYFISLYTSTIENSNFQNPIIADTLLNASGFNNANAVISSDKKHIYFSRCEYNGPCAIYRSQLNNGMWSKAEKMNNMINRPGYTSTQPSIAPFKDNQEVLFFVTNQPGGQGKLDIWYSILDANGNSSVTRPLGEEINSPEDDITPFYDYKNKVLYFSSTWHPGIGGYDIFKAKGEPEKFEKPENMGKPFNTNANDLYYTEINDTAGFITSNRSGGMYVEGETCCNDIYLFTRPNKTTIDTTPTIETTLQKLSKYLPLTLYFHNDEPNPRSTDTTTKRNYIDTYKEYITMIETYKKEYSRGLSGEEAEDAQIDIELFFEDYVKKGAKKLEEFSKLLLEALRDGFEIELTIKGYASTLAKSDYNVNLTKRRIASLKNYLRDYQNGVLNPYINNTDSSGTTLSFIDIPFGEYKASTLVSDNLNDLKNSVYSRSAALERKIEILGVSVKDDVKTSLSDTTVNELGKLSISETSISLKALLQQGINTKEVQLKNTGKSPVEIITMQSKNPNIKCKWNKEQLEAGEEKTLTIFFENIDQLSKNSEHLAIEIITNGYPNIYTIIFE